MCTIQATVSFRGNGGVREMRARVSARAAHTGAGSCRGYARHQSHRLCLGGNRWLGNRDRRETTEMYALFRNSSQTS